MPTVSFRIPKPLLNALDELPNTNIYQNRSEKLIEAINLLLLQEKNTELLEINLHPFQEILL